MHRGQGNWFYSPSIVSCQSAQHPWTQTSAALQSGCVINSLETVMSAVNNEFLSVMSIDHTYLVLLCAISTVHAQFQGSSMLHIQHMHSTRALQWQSSVCI